MRRTLRDRARRPGRRRRAPRGDHRQLRRGGARLPRRRSARRGPARPVDARASTASSCSAACASATPRLQVILMTAFSTVQSAIEAMKLGAFEYLIKPFTDEELLAAVDGALRPRPPARRAPPPPARATPADRPRAAASATWSAAPSRCAACSALVERTAETDATVLDHRRDGHRQGAGRARHPRALSAARARPFVAVNCAALPETLLESELFGHEQRRLHRRRQDQRAGRFEQADGGTVFLDEIGEMPPPLQAKLLRVLQEREFERVGGTETIRVDVRVVAATNRDLDDRDRRGPLPRGPLLPPERRRRSHSRRCASAARTSRCSRRHFLAEKCAAARGRPQALTPEAPMAAAPALRLPRQRPRAREPHRARRGPLRRRPRRPRRLSRVLGGRHEPPRSSSRRSSAAPWQRLGHPAIGGEGSRAPAGRDAPIAAYPDLPNEEIARLLGTSRRVFELRLAEFGIAKRQR